MKKLERQSFVGYVFELEVINLASSFTIQKR
jgi:hypothetical protein